MLMPPAATVPAWQPASLCACAQVMYGDLRRAPALETEVRRTASRVGRGARPIESMNTGSVQQLFDDHEALLSDLGAAASDESRACVRPPPIIGS